VWDKAEEGRQMVEARRASIAYEMWRQGFVIVDYDNSDGSE
jgi:hypothetical protein